MSTNPFDDDGVTPVTTNHPHPTAGSPVPQMLLFRAYAFTAPFEGNINHMYLDTRGHVTCGVGFMIPSPRAAALLPFAPSAEIASDFANVANCPIGHPAHWYKQFTRSTLPDSAVRAEFYRRAANFVSGLRRTIPNYDVIPESAQLALLDMAYNLGSGVFNTGWPRLREAVASQDWVTAAAQCRRQGIQPERNAATARLFFDAESQAHGNA